MGLKEKAGSKITEKIVRESVLYIRKDPEKNIPKLRQLLSSIPGHPTAKGFIDDIMEPMTHPDDPGYCYVPKLFENLDVAQSSRLLSNFAYNVLLNGFKKAEDLRTAGKAGGPFTLMFSPTMKCNLHCKGCYAGEYDQESELSLETIDSIITSGKKLGTYFYTVLGGEPFIRWNELVQIFKKHDDCVFQIFTNGTLIDDEKIDELLTLKNIAVVFSIEGREMETDFRRGEGIYKQVTDAMLRYKKRGGLFGFSITTTHQNFDLVTSEEFMDFVESLGPVFGWYFMYMPVGKDASTDLMLTPEERVRLGEKLRSYRKRKPLFMVDFFNDAPYVSGCISSGRYIHINNRGDVEPCIFCHFAQSNIHDVSLEEALSSEFFESIRCQQPYHENLMTPCMMLDHPEVWRAVHAENKMLIHPTHAGANDILLEKREFFDDYSKKIQELTAPIWEEQFAQAHARKLAGEHTPQNASK